MVEQVQQNADLSNNMPFRKLSFMGLGFGGAFHLGFLIVWVLLRSSLGYEINFYRLYQTTCFYYLLIIQLSILIQSSNIGDMKKPFFSVLIVAQPILLIFLPLGLLANLFTILGSIALLYTWQKIVISKEEWMSYLSFVFFGMIFALWMSSYYSPRGIYASYAAKELGELGILHMDFLYTSSIVAMLKEYNIISTGVHGLVPVGTHIFTSHWLAAISKIYGYSAITTLALFSTLVLIPAAIFSFFSVCEKIVSEKACGNSRKGDRQVFFVLISITLLCAYLTQFNIIKNHNFSQSFIFFSLSLPALCHAINIERSRIVDLLLLLVAIILTFFVKPHTAVFMSVLLVLCVFLKPSRVVMVFVSVLSLCVLLFLFWLPADSAYILYLSGFDPFNIHIRNFTTAWFYGFVFLIMYLLYKSSFDLRRNRTLKILVAALIFCVLFVFLRGQNDGNSHYFSYLLYSYAVFHLCRHFYEIKKFLKNYLKRFEFIKAKLVFISVLPMAIFVFKDTYLVTHAIKYFQSETNTTQFVELKEKVRDLPGRNFSLYFPQNKKNKVWGFVHRCLSKPFLATAILERPLVFGIPTRNICNDSLKSYGYDFFPQDIDMASPNDIQLCEYAVTFGFFNVYEVLIDESVELRNIQCS